MHISGRLRPFAGTIVRGGIGLLGKAGLANRLIRNARYNVVGIECRWSDDETYVRRGLVVEQKIDGVAVRFFVTDENDHIQQHHMWGQWYEKGELELIAKHFDGGTFVDVGANVGNHSLYAALVMKAAKVLSFEPNPPAFSACKYNILLNDLTDRVEVFNFGLSDEAERAEVKSTPERNLGGTRLQVGVGSLILKLGDDVLASENPTFIKIDVETFEMKVLQGLRQTIARCRPILFVEVDAANDGAFHAFLNSVGYKVSHHLPLPENAGYLCRPGNLP